MGRRRTGSAIRRAGRFFARVTLHREPKLPSGEHPRCEVPLERVDGRPLTEAYARSLAQRYQSRYDEGTWQPERATARGAPPDVSVAEWVDRWLAKQTYRTAADERSKVALWLKGTALSRIELVKVTPEHIVDFVEALKRTDSKRTGKPPSARTQLNLLDPIHRALRSAVFQRRLAADPFAVVPPELLPKPADADPAARAKLRFRRREVELLLTEPKIPPRWRAFWALLLLTGARESEALALRWMDLEPDAPLARVVIAEQIDPKTQERIPTKTRTTREVPLHPLLARVLEHWRTVEWAKDYGREPTPSDLIAPARAERGSSKTRTVGKPMRLQYVHRRLQLCLTLCQLRKHRVHDLRHTFVSLCVDAGMSGEVASRWTHAPLVKGGAREQYTQPSWERQCEEMLRLTLTLPDPAAAPR